MRDPTWPHVALGTPGFDHEYVPLRDASRRDIPQPANDPAHRIFIFFERPGRPAKLDFAIAEKIRHELAERRLSLAFCRKRKSQRPRSHRDDRSGRGIRKHKTVTPKGR